VLGVAKERASIKIKSGLTKISEERLNAKIMTEQVTQPCPFEIGDAVMMRSASLKIRKFWHLIPGDIGIVTGIRISNVDSSRWMITVHWQKYTSKKEPIYRHCRLKHAIKKTRKKSND
jgi:hypothetical protein